MVLLTISDSLRVLFSVSLSLSFFLSLLLLEVAGCFISACSFSNLAKIGGHSVDKYSSHLSKYSFNFMTSPSSSFGAPNSFRAGCLAVS